MAVLPSAREAIHFGPFEVDLRAGELRKHGIKIRLQEQPFQVLRVLLEQAGQVVTREELQQRIWPADTFVDFDHGLNNAIRRLREALSDSAENPKFIETLSRRGYRFIATVNGNGEAAAAAVAQGPLPAAPNAADEPQPWHRKNAFRILAAAAFVGLLLGVATGRVGKWFSRGAASPAIHSLAVLPLQNLSSDATQEYFSDGMTDTLITDLAQIGSLKVISRTSSMQYKQTKKTLPEIAKELNVDGVVEGTVQRSGNRVQINVQLIQGPTDKHVWANSYERDVRDVFALERDVAKEIASQIQAQLGPTPAGQVQERPVSPKVLEAYLQGTFHLDKEGQGFGDEEKRKAEEFFQQAIDADPNYAPAYVGIAEAHRWLTAPSSEDAALSKKADEKALALDARSPDALVILADAKLFMDLDWQGAEEKYRQAISINPSHAGAHEGLGTLLVALGRTKEAVTESQLAQELDPNWDHLSGTLYFARDYDRSIAVLKMILQNRPDNGSFHVILFRDYMEKGMFKEAIAEMERTVTMFGLPDVAAKVHHAFTKAGYRAAVLEVAQEFEHLSATKQVFVPGNLAELYAGLGDKDRAFYWLEQAYQRRWLSSDPGVIFLKVDPMLDPLRSDPRFKDLIRRIGLLP